MVTKQQHIIHKHEFDLEINAADEEESYAVQQRIVETLKEKTLPALDDLFSELIPPELTLRLDKLEFDLGEIDINDLDRSLLKVLRKQVEEEVTRRRERARVVYEERKRAAKSQSPAKRRQSAEQSSAEAAVSGKDWLEKTSETVDNSTNREQLSSEEARLLTRSESEGSSILHFLETGSWPWHLMRQKQEAKNKAAASGPSDQTETKTVNVLQKWLQEKPVQLLQTLILARPSERAIRRLLAHTTDDKILELISLAAPVVATFVIQLRKDITKMMSAGVITRKPTYAPGRGKS